MEGWDETKWNEMITKWFKPEHVKIIQKNSEDIGILLVKEKEDALFVESISIVPMLQRQGIGTRIIQDIIETAKTKAVPVRLSVLKTNLRAKELYLRLGFQECGTTETHFQMELNSAAL